MMIGQQISHWIIEKKLGDGGMGEVWRARHAVLEHPVAIKVMADKLLTEDRFRARFLQEATAQARLQHPHIIGVCDFFEERGVYYLSGLTTSWTDS